MANDVRLISSKHMSRRGFLEQSTRHRASDAIRFIESATCVEVVVAVRKAAGKYWDSCAAVGGLLAATVFSWMWFSESVYHVTWIAIDTVLAFGFGFGVCAYVSELRRLLTFPRQRRAAIRRAARRAFEQLGIAKTKDRTGVLVFVTLFERAVLVVPDEGVMPSVLGEEYAQAVAEMERAVGALDEDAFLSALRRFALPFSQALPRQPDDENELCDDVA